jgi:hypothetical protein
MPRYFFHIYNDVIAEDEEGAELPDMAAAREHAICGARSLMAEEVVAGRLCLHHRIEVADEQGRVVMKIPFRELVNIEG